MSVSTECGIMVGLPYEDILVYEDIDDLLDDGELERTSLYYDSYIIENIVGIWVEQGHGSEIDLEELAIQTNEAKKKFFDIFKQEAKIYLGLDVT
jgi:hypothetical protein